MTTEEKPKHLVRKIGIVASDRMDKTIVVRVERRLMHPLYKKFVTKYSTLYAHDEDNTARVGDEVEVVFTRPMSRTKTWRLERVLTPASGADA